MNFIRFVFILSFGLVALYFLLTPQAVTKRFDKEVAKIEVGKFELLQFNEEFLMRELAANRAFLYGDRIVVSELDLDEYTRYENEVLKANSATYQDKKLHFHGGVRYERADGFAFSTKRLFYDKKKDFIYVPENFEMSTNVSSVKARDMVYDRKNGTISFLDVIAQYEVN